MGKYDKIVAGLPRLGEESSYQDKVNHEKDQIRKDKHYKSQAGHLAQLYLEARAKKEAVAELMYEAQLHLTAVEQLLIDQYEVEGTTRLTLDSGESIGVTVEPYAQVKDHDVFRQWCLDQGLEKLMVLPWQTVNKLTKERLLEGENEPPGVKAFLKTGIRLNRR